MTLEELLDQVHDCDSFLRFVRELIADRRAATSQDQHTSDNADDLDVTGWENDTIEDFLAASLAWADDSQMGTLQGLPQEPSWKAFAVFLYCGKIYE